MYNDDEMLFSDLFLCLREKFGQSPKRCCAAQDEKEMKKGESLMQNVRIFSSTGRKLACELWRSILRTSNLSWMMR